MQYADRIHYDIISHNAMFSKKKVCKYDMQNNHNDSVEYSYVKCLVLYTEF